MSDKKCPHCGHLEAAHELAGLGEKELVCQTPGCNCVEYEE